MLAQDAAISFLYHYHLCFGLILLRHKSNLNYFEPLSTSRTNRIIGISPARAVRTKKTKAALVFIQ
jgi:hypothetical protein